MQHNHPIVISLENYLNHTKVEIYQIRTTKQCVNIKGVQTYLMRTVYKCIHRSQQNSGTAFSSMNEYIIKL